MSEELKAAKAEIERLKTIIREAEWWVDVEIVTMTPNESCTVNDSYTRKSEIISSSCMICGNRLEIDGEHDPTCPFYRWDTEAK